MFRSSGWITFNAVDAGTNEHSAIFVAPFHKAPTNRAEWIPITDGRHGDDKPHSLHDRKLVYFTSDGDGHRCIRARLPGPEMGGTGAPFPIYHSMSDGIRWMTSTFERSQAANS